MSNVIPGDENSDDDASMQPRDPVQAPDTDEGELPIDTGTTIQEDEGAMTTFGMQDLAELHIIPNDKKPTTLLAQDELIQWHHQLGCLPYNHIRSMSPKEILLKRLLKCTKPFCAACQYGKLTRKPWQSKEVPMTPIWKATSSGQIISINQLESSTAGFIAQLKGKLTTQRYWYVTLLVDQYSQYAYVYLQQAITSAETVQAKHSFERLVEDMGIRVHHYYADNGQFTDKGFVEDCQKQRQGLTYCGVNAHFQNGIAEKKIRDLQEQTRMMMLHGVCKCISMLSIHLWSYGLCTANDICQSTPRKGSDISPIELFSGVTMCPKLKHYHSFGCPTYILDKALQAQKSLPKWQSRARLDTIPTRNG